MSDFRRLLLEISNELTDLDLNRLKFLCKDEIPAGTAERIREPFELFDELEKGNFLSEKKREFLASKLSDLNRVSLGKKLLGSKVRAFSRNCTCLFSFL